MYSKKSLAQKMEGTESPFLGNFTFPVTKAPKWTGKKVIDEHGNETREPVYFERTPHTSLFLDEKCEEKTKCLSAGAQRLLLHILFHIEKNKDYIVLDTDTYLKAQGLKSAVAFKNARVELCTNNFLVKAPPRGVYWINPARFFRGSRPNTFPNNMDVQYEVKH